MSDAAIIISVNLPGKLGSLLKHTTKQNYSVKVTNPRTQQTEILTRKIRHTDRIPSKCIREIQISPRVLKGWIDGPPPRHIDLKKWKKLNDEQKIAAYVDTFDEGYGVKYE